MKHTSNSGMSLRIVVVLILLISVAIPWGCSTVAQSSAGSNAPAQSLPVADAGADQATSIALAVSISLDGSASTGNDLHYLWSQSSSNPEFVTINQETSVTATVFLNLEGTYNFYLSVSNDVGTSTDDVVIVAM